MEDYPNIPLYRGDELDALKSYIDPSLSIVLPHALWDIDSFKILPDGSKLLYGIIVSKLINGDGLSGQGKSDCTCLSKRQITDLLGCSLSSAQAYRTGLANSGLITKEIGDKVRGEGKGKHAVLYPQQSVNDCGTAKVVIPLSLFSCDNFIWLPDGAKLVYGYLFANMVNGNGFIDTMGNCCQFLEKGKIVKRCLSTRPSMKKFLNALSDSEFIDTMHVVISKPRVKHIDLLYIRRLTD